MDCGFPIINYEKNKTPYEWGFAHGCRFKEAIVELCEIRKKLMLDKNPKLESQLDKLSLEQWIATQKLDEDLYLELDGIRKGAGLSITQIVILNNYTDFRDIELPEEGCTVASVSHKGRIFSGQTWDMHGSAKRFVCLINIPKTKDTPAMVMFSLVGCVGMMGYNSSKLFMGVNNINTANAKASVIWPALVRHCLKSDSYKQMKEKLLSTEVTSGHNYILASTQESECFEVAPEVADRVGRIGYDNNATMFHTNHCLGDNVKKIETSLAVNSTTHIRYELTEKKIGRITELDGLERMFKDHENYPKSICSHFQSGAQDPSMTCGGGVFSMDQGFGKIWRGCPEHDANFKQYMIELMEDGFIVK